jgi:hypothetical protein
MMLRSGRFQTVQGNPEVMMPRVRISLLAATFAFVSLAQPVAAWADQNIVDSKGKPVGIEVGGPPDGWARRKMADGTWTAFRIGYAGFRTGTFQVAIPLYVSQAADCSGTKYFYTNLYNTGLIYKTSPASTKLYFRYAYPPFKSLVIKSEYYWNSNTGVGQCVTLGTPITNYVGAFKTIDLSTLALTPPFIIQ